MDGGHLGLLRDGSRHGRARARDRGLRRVVPEAVVASRAKHHLGFQDRGPCAMAALTMDMDGSLAHAGVRSLDPKYILARLPTIDRPAACLHPHVGQFVGSSVGRVGRSEGPCKGP